MSGVRVAPRQEWDDLKLEESFCRASTVGQSAGATKLSAHSLSCSCLRIVGGWERDAASIIPCHTDLDMDHTIDPSVQQHLNVSNFEVYLSRPPLDTVC